MTRALLFPTGDAAALAARLARLLADAGLRARLGEAARRRAAIFDLRHVLDLQVQLYHSLAQRS